MHRPMGYELPMSLQALVALQQHPHAEPHIGVNSSYPVPETLKSYEVSNLPRLLQHISYQLSRMAIDKF